jgi:CBS-domain-containing membrane protein
MKAADVMVSNVITVGPEATVQDVAELLLANRISAVPVVGQDGELVGIISEADLIRRTETDTGRRQSRWRALLNGSESLAAEFVKANAHRVADIMTRKVIVATTDTSLHDIAAMLEKNGIKRVPVVKNRKLVGIVSRANLVQALATVRKEVKAATATSDSMIREDVMARLGREPWTKVCRLNVIVHDGTLELWGVVRSHAEKTAIRVAVEQTPGVRAVNDNLIVQSINSELQLAIVGVVAT